MFKWQIDLKSVALGNTQLQAAQERGVSEQVVVKNLERARRLLCSKTTTEAVYRAAKIGIICFLLTANLPLLIEDTARINRRTPTVRISRIVRWQNIC